VAALARAACGGLIDREQPMKPLVTLDQLESSHPLPDELDVLDDFARWAALAHRGDASAMLAIARTLYGCSSFEPTTRIRPDGTPESDSSRCGNIPVEERVPPIDWMERAAALGDLRAMLDYGLNAKAGAVTEEVGRRALGYLDAAAQAGLQEAFFALHAAHRAGWYGPSDPSLAAAYLLALDVLAPGTLDPGDLQRMLGGLRAHEQTVATQRAQAIVASMRR
jgi:hypothetical protein